MPREDVVHAADRLIAQHQEIEAADREAAEHVLQASADQDAEQARFWLAVVAEIANRRHADPHVADDLDINAMLPARIAELLVERFGASAALNIAENQVFRLSESGQESEADQWLVVCEAIERLRSPPPPF